MGYLSFGCKQKTALCQLHMISLLCLHHLSCDGCMNIYQAETFHFVGRQFTRLLIWIAELAFSEIYISEVKLGNIL